MYSLHEKVVYPGHGVAKIIRIVEKNVAGSLATFFELKFLHKEMTILVPTENTLSIGIRKLSSEEDINMIFNILSEQPKEMNFQELTSSSWNKRNKSYQYKLKSGDLIEISKIYRDLQHISLHKELSFGERTLLAQIEALLSEEISLVKNVMEEQAIETLRSFFAHQPKFHNQKTPQMRAFI